jgi:chromosome segregation ATPase
MRAIFVALFLAVFALPTPVLGEGGKAIPAAMKKVIDMLSNLITTLEAEGADDEAKFAHFTKWVKKTQAETELEISTLQTSIENTKATLADLYAQKGELTGIVSHLKSEVATVTGQINTATDKRNEEHSSYVTEQTNFDNAIKACGKAVDILSKHYGDGTVQELEKPEFMSLLNENLATIRQAALSLGRKVGRHSGRHLRKGRAVSLLQGPNDRFQEKTGEALTIVDQVKELASSFAEDQMTSQEEEAKLQKLYDALMTEKRQVLADFVAALAEKTKQLQQCEGDIASNESKLAMLTKNLADQQAYLASITEQFKAYSEAFANRKKDRNEETAAVQQALGVLDKYNTFVQIGAKSNAAGVKCKGCEKAISLLKQKAQNFKSALLEAAAMAASGSDAIDEIVSNLQGLIARMDEEQKFETEHKEWCEQETSLTIKKRDYHRSICETLKGVLANLVEVVEEKKYDLGVNNQAQNDEAANFVERTKLRDEEKEEFDNDLREHVEAITALNEAIDILAKYYASKGAALAQMTKPGGGAKVVNMLSHTRAEFEQAKGTLEKDEAVAMAEYAEDKAVHIKTESDLVHQEDTLTVEKQSAESAIDQNTDDLQSNQNEVASAESYLKRLGKSCYPLIARYDERVKLRAEEKKAVQDAIEVLKSEAL